MPRRRAGHPSYPGYPPLRPAHPHPRLRNPPSFIVHSLLSHAEADNSVCTIAAHCAALKHWRSLTALTKRGDEHFVCLACRSFSAHVEGSHAHYARRPSGTRGAGFAARALRSRRTCFALFSYYARRSRQPSRSGFAPRPRGTSGAGFALLAFWPYLSRRSAFSPWADAPCDPGGPDSPLSPVIPWGPAGP